MHKTSITLLFSVMLSVCYAQTDIQTASQANSQTDYEQKERRPNWQQYFDQLNDMDDMESTNLEELYDQMCELEERIQSLSMGRPVWYMNRTVKAALRKLTSNKTNVQYTPDQITSRPLMTFNEIPVHVCDAIVDTEAVVR